MALIKCPECGKEVSDKAIACPSCGFPIETTQVYKADSSEIITESEKDADTENGVGCLSQALAFFIPIVGFILGGSYISANKTSQGKELIQLAVGGVILALVGFTIYYLILNF